MATKEPTVTERVTAGAALLDNELEGWEASVKLDRLDMSVGAKAWNDTSDVPCGCILMQLYGSYVEGKTELGIGGPEAEELGFEAMEWPVQEEYNELHDAWNELIGKRRA